MALHALSHLHIPITSHFPSRMSRPATLTLRYQSLTLRPIEQRRLPVASVVEESQESSGSEEQRQEQMVAQSELKKAMQERKEREGESDNFWGGVAQEIREIEWPSFGKVLGTTGVVLTVILGSSVVLLTVNAVLAELSDRVFAGKGVQDFFS